MLFITNRKLKADNTSSSARLSFDIENNAPSQEVYFCIKHSEKSYQELGSNKFFHDLRDSGYKQILIYIHGFNNLPEEHVFVNAKLLQEHFDGIKPDNILVVPLIWPCDNDFGIIKDYWDDQLAADMSGFSVQRALNFFRSWSENSERGSCYKFINILAHSMGNRVFREALVYWRKYTLPQGVPRMFRNIFLVAPDIANETLEYGKRGEIICNAGRNIVIYHANDDFALRASKAMNLKNMIASRRLGHSGPEKVGNIPPNVYMVDCDEVNNSYDPPKGHTYFLPIADGRQNVVLKHIYDMLTTARFSAEKDKRKVILS